jgi:hypothetical protein
MGRLAAVGCAALVTALGCSSDKPAAPPPRPEVVPPDAAPPPPVVAVPAFDPLTGLGLDDDDDGGRRERPRQRRRLEITLRSTPSGALAAVDGAVIGRTPTLWEGEFTGREREFTFVLPGYSIARYRFAPITSGVVHGRLEKMGDGDAGVPEIPQPDVARPEPPPRPAPPAAPATLPTVTIDASAPDAAAATTPPADALVAVEPETAPTAAPNDAAVP